jgi:hypothetical protein
MQGIALGGIQLIWAVATRHGWKTYTGIGVFHGSDSTECHFLFGIAHHALHQFSPNAISFQSIPWRANRMGFVNVEVPILNQNKM